jgi:anthranilate phosphoribosyltransferase
MAHVMQALGANHVLVVHSEDGMDEVSLAVPTHVCELKNGELTEFTLIPEQFGLTRASVDSIRVNNPEESKTMMLRALNNEASPARDIVLLNSGVALYTAGIAESIEHGIERARQAITSGAARAKVEEFAQYTQQFKKI